MLKTQWTELSSKNSFFINMLLVPRPWRVVKFDYMAPQKYKKLPTTHLGSQEGLQKCSASNYFWFSRFVTVQVRGWCFLQNNRDIFLCKCITHYRKLNVKGISLKSKRFAFLFIACPVESSACALTCTLWWQWIEKMIRHIPKFSLMHTGKMDKYWLFWGAS